MRSIERRFREHQESNPFISTYINFIRAVRGQHFNKQAVIRWFNQLVDKEDYESADKKSLVTQVISQNTLEDNQK